MSELARDYLVLCFLSALGVVQIAAAYARLQGLLLVRRPLLSVVLGLALVLAGFLWFFLPGPRLVPDTSGGLDGNQQSLYFALCAGAAVAATLALSSVVNHRRLRFQHGATGLDALRDATYLQTMLQTVKRLWKRSPRRTRRSFFGSTAG